MQRFFIYLKYDGTAYHGWQVQPNARSVQGELERALSTLLRTEVSIVGAGRTDTGVHARMMTAHFDADVPIDCQQLAYKLNRILPRDIAVDRVVPVPADMHARFSAVARTYYYYVHTRKDPFARAYSFELPYKVDFDKMNQAAATLLTVSDFAAFCKSNSDAKTTLCHVTHAQWHQDSDTQWHFQITANRFLRNMVRAIVGTLIDIGRGKISQQEFAQIIAGRNRQQAGESMPGNALFLENIEYASPDYSELVYGI